MDFNGYTFINALLSKLFKIFFIYIELYFVGTFQLFNIL